MDFGNFFQVPVNYFVVFLCALAATIIGYLWYGPLFGKEWMKLAGFTPKTSKANNMTSIAGLMFLSSLLMAYTLFHFIWYAAPGSYTLFISLKTALWAWIGLVIPVSLSKHLYSADKKPLRLLCLESAYYLVALMAMAVIFYLFRAV